jgi:hypothetical protein
MSGARSFRDVAGAEERAAGIRLPVHFHPEVFELLRKRAERERTCVGDVVVELVERGLGG